MSDGRAPGDIALSFLAAMEAAGVKPSEPILHSLMSGDLVRFQVEGDRAGRRNGWARLHLDGHPAGAFGCNKRQIHEKWSADHEKKAYTKAERADYAKRMQAQREDRAAAKQAVEQAAGDRARALLDKAQPAGKHPYLVTKHIAGTGMRQLGDLLLVPMYGPDGAIWNIQCIAADGQKRFLKGGRTAGLTFMIEGGLEAILVAEGAATAAALNRATGATCYSAFSAGNLLAVAQMARLVSPDMRIVLCADDDQHLIDHPSVRRNVGLDEATEAAIAIGAAVAVPPRPSGSRADASWDFADISDDGVIRRALAKAVRPSRMAQSPNTFGSLEARLSRGPR